MTGPSLSGLPARAIAQVVPLVFGLSPFAQYRANSAVNPLSNQIGTMPVWITADPNLQVAKPFSRAKPDEIFGAFDPDLTDPGDYLVGAVSVNSAAETFFIASQDSPMPSRLVYCARVMSFTRAAPQASTGLNTGYGGRTQATDVPLMTGWPVACVQGTKGEAAPTSVRLPGDIREPWWTILLPSYSGVTLNMGDHATDDLGRNYTISSAELTSFGWRLTAMLSST